MRGSLRRRAVVAVFGLAVTAGAARAQDRPAAAVEGQAGWAGFVDEGVVNHSVVGAAARLYLTPRLAVGPELVYMVGPSGDRDLFFTGNLTFDLVAPSPARQATPYLVVGGGLFRHTSRLLVGTFTSNEGAFTAGGGVRVRLGERAFLAPEARAGWETHVRLGVSIGVELGK